MVSALINATLAGVGYSLWVRRDTWWSRWEIGVSLAIALEGVALLLWSPWGSVALGPLLYRGTGLWNVQNLLGHLCVVIAITANIYHVLVRLTDPERVQALMRRHLAVPVWSGMVLMVTLFVIADEGYLPDGFTATDTCTWFTAYWAVTGGLWLFLSLYAGRTLLLMKSDPRARKTYYLYMVSSVFAVAACVSQIGSVWAGINAAVAVWACACLSITVFAVGSARSWQAKAAWFTAGDRRDDRADKQSHPPQSLG